MIIDVLQIQHKYISETLNYLYTKLILFKLFIPNISVLFVNNYLNAQYLMH